MNKLQIIEQLRKALQMFAASLTDENAMEISEVYPKWQFPKEYKMNDIFGYGVNGVGDAQLYRVLQDHTSQESWKPDITPSIYKAIGIAPSGYPEWSQPVGAGDAYNAGDIVSLEDVLWISDVDNNVWKPGVYGWSLYNQ